MRTGLLSLALFGLLTGTLWAKEQFPPNSKPLSEILHMVESKGYSHLKSASLDNGIWEIEGLHGKNQIELHVNPVTGEILSEEADIHSHLPPATAKTALQIAKQLEETGYAPIYELEWEKPHWEAEVLHQNVRKKLHISADSGKILSEVQDD